MRQAAGSASRVLTLGRALTLGRTVGLGLGLGLALGLGGCASSEPQTYVLSPLPVATQAAAAAPAIIEVQRLALAGYLDRAAIVRGSDGARLLVDDGERWAEPLADMAGRVLVADLAARLPQSRVFFAGGAITLKPDAVVEIDIAAFEPRGAAISLQASYAIRRGSQRLSDMVAIEVPMPDRSVNAQTAAMSAALADLASRIASRLAQ